MAIAVAVAVGSTFLMAAVIHAGEFGSAWTEQGTNALPVATSQHTTLAFNDKLWVIGGDNAGTATRKVYSSSDGITWAESGTDALPSARRNHCSSVFGNQMWVIGGEDSAGDAQTSIYFSTDGVTWNSVFIPLPEARTDLACATTGGNGIVASGGTTGSTPQSDTFFITTVAGGVAVSIGTIPSARTNAILLSNGGLDLTHIGGSSDVSVEEEIYSSIDAVIWAEDPDLPVKRSRGGGLIADGRLYYLGGIDATTPLTSAGQDDVLSSVNGGEWAYVGNGALPANLYDFGYAMFQGKAWITGGDVAGTQVRTVYATDDIAGLTEMPDADESISDIGSSVSFPSQSADTATNELPIIEIAQQFETVEGFPYVTLTVILAYVSIATALCFALGKMAPDSKWVTVLAVMGLTTIGYVVGSEAISWYIFLAIGGWLFGAASIGSSIQG